MIFCVEDDHSIRELMIYALNSAGYATRGFHDGKSMFRAIKDEMPSLIMLDIMLPDEDGIQILKRLRSGEKTSEVPVILATAKITWILTDLWTTRSTKRFIPFWNGSLSSRMNWQERSRSEESLPPMSPTN